MRARYVVCTCMTSAWITAAPAPGATVGTAFTYQGQLIAGGTPVDDTCGFRFSLWDADVVGSQVGTSPQTINAVGVVDGTFSAAIDFGVGAIDGTARWLEIEVQCSGDAGFVLLSPRVELTPAPHALALPGLVTQQNASSPNLVGGHSANTVAIGVVGATVGGGGETGFNNQVTDNFGTVGGGRKNQAGNGAVSVSDRRHATVGGGYENTASGSYSTVTGGETNTASGGWSAVCGGAYGQASGTLSSVGGGDENWADGDWSVISGGRLNAALGPISAVGGGEFNEALGAGSVIGGGSANETDGIGSTIGGGQENYALGDSSTIAGGYLNDASGLESTVAGGKENEATGSAAAIGGGRQNVASGSRATVSGGFANTASGIDSAIAGGTGNVANGDYSFVAGGSNNKSGGANSFAGGFGAVVRDDAATGDFDGDEGTFVWGGADFLSFFTSTGPDQFLIRAAGGVGINTNDPDVGLEINGGTELSVSDNTGFVMIGDQDGPNLAFDTDELQARNNAATAALLINPAGGNVGIGTNVPGSALDVAGEVRSTGATGGQVTSYNPNNQGASLHLSWLNDVARIRVGGTGVGNANGLDIQRGGDNSLMRILDNGNVGIDTAVPETRLHLVGGSDATIGGGGYLTLGTTNGANVAIDNNEIMARNNGAAAALGINADGGNVHIIGTGIGDVGIGTNSPSARLEIVGSLKVDTNTLYVNDVTNRVGIGTTSPTEALHVVGDACVTGTVGACSDRRYKTDIEPINDALSLIERLRGVHFNWRRDEYPDYKFSEKPQIGFIAQEIADIIPEVVTQGDDGYYWVDYGRLTPVIVEAIKVQARLINEKEEELKEVRQRLERLEMVLTEEMDSDQ